MKNMFYVLIAIVLMMSIAACSDEEDAAVQESGSLMAVSPSEMATTIPNVVDIAVDDGRFTTLVTALQAADLVETLSGPGFFTVFAPTDDAFNALPEGTLEGLLEDIPVLTDILTYHVVSGTALAELVVGLESVQTIQGEFAKISVEGGEVMVDDSKIIITDIVGSNGVVHVIDKVLMPPSISPEPVAMLPSIVDIAVDDGRFTTLVAALQAADLVETLSGPGPFTVFAPTDDAFNALPEGTVAGLLEDIPALTEVLTYHVVSGSVLAETVVGLDSAKTLQGADVEILVMGGEVMLDDSKVIITDIVGSNGVVHVIDKVLMPPS